MILVDSSVWIDFFNQAPTPQRLQLVRWLEGGDVSIGTADGHTLLHRDADFESLKTLGELDTWPQ